MFFTKNSLPLHLHLRIKGMKVAIIGGGAAGMFLAINLYELMAKKLDTNRTICNNKKFIDIVIFEKTDKILSKVLVSGGGRCNCTNNRLSTDKLRDNNLDLKQIYPRGHHLMKKLLRNFSVEDTINWFSTHGVKLKAEQDGRMFPITNNSRTIIDMFLDYTKKYNIKILYNTAITNLKQVENFDFICITTGGMLHNKHNFDLQTSNTKIITPKPSLFGFYIKDNNLQSLMGTAINDVTLTIKQTKFKTSGSILVTHKGISGPCVLKLSSIAAEYLYNENYKTILVVNWVNLKDEDIRKRLEKTIKTESQRIIVNTNPFSLSQRFWEYLLQKVIPNRLDIRYKDLTQKEINRIINILCNDEYQTQGRATNKDEFVTCGGIDLDEINHNTLQLKSNEKIFFGGEILNIDGITGGYNLQACWSGAYTASQGIINYYLSKNHK